LRKHQSNTIAIVIPEIADSFFSQAINGIESIAHHENYHTLIYLTHDSYEREACILEEFKSGRVDGIIMSAASDTEHTTHIDQVQQAGIPVVFFDRDCPAISSAKIKTNDFDSAYNAVCHLIERGCKNISLITVKGFVSIFTTREDGYKKALFDNNLNFSRLNIVQCSNKLVDENQAIISDHLALVKPDGLLLTVEHLATAAYLACNQMNIKIPGDIKIAGFTNQSTAQILNPSLTAIVQPAFKMGQKAAELLFHYLSHKSFRLEDEQLTLPSSLIIGSSTEKGRF